MACKGCTTLNVSYVQLGLNLQLTAPAGPACVTTTPHTAMVYGNVLDMHVITCVRGDSTFYQSLPLGDPVLGDFVLG